MLQKYLFAFLLISSFVQSQDNYELKLVDSTNIDAEAIFNIDTFGTLYYSTEDNTFNKKTKDTTITYTNFQLGKITTANAFNPLKVNLFYQDFNTVIILDNRLAEIFKVDFNTIIPYKNVTYVSTGFDNTLWIFNQDVQQLELYDFKTNKIRLKTVPIQFEILDLKSDYNFCYLLTEKYLYIYNYFGSLVEKYPNNNYKEMAFSKGRLVLKTDDGLFILPKNTSEIRPIEIKNLLINQFLVTNESLYLYHDGILRHYQLN